jgi:glycerol uptake facilitator-like aquaporin
VSAVSLGRRVVAEGLGTAMLLAVVVGSGIMAERLSNGNLALALLANSVATGAGLVALILAFGSVSGAHFNPAVTLAAVGLRELRPGHAVAYVAAQCVGALVGVVVAHAMYGVELVSVFTHPRAGAPLVWSEAVATFGLLAVIHAVSRRRPDATPLAVGLYITSAYWFTASTSFANPAVTLARTVTRTFAGIRAEDAPGFVFGQLVGAAAATMLLRWLVPPENARS